MGYFEKQQVLSDKELDLFMKDNKFSPLPGYENFEATTQKINAEIYRRKLPMEIIDPDKNLIT